MSKVQSRMSSVARRVGSMGIVLLLGSAVGCSSFFPATSTTTTTTGTTNTGDFAYVASSLTTTTAGIYTVEGFTVGTGTLSLISGATETLAFAPIAMAVTPSNGYLYVAGSGVIYGYAISSTGTLTPVVTASSSQALGNADIVSMVISPDGQWLLGIDSGIGQLAGTVVVDEFQIGSDGLLTAENGVVFAPATTGTLAPSSIAIAPTGNFVAASLGTGGDVLFSFATSTGTLAYTAQVAAPTTTTADQSVTFNTAGDTLFIARSGTDGGIVPYVIGSSGTTLTAPAGAPYPAGNGPSSMLVDKTGSYLYVGNRVDSTISGFAIGTGGVLTALSGSPYATGTAVSALGYDNTGDYLLSTAVEGNPDLSMFSFDTTTGGKLDTSTTALLGDPTEPAGSLAIALTH